MKMKSSSNLPAFEAYLRGKVRPGTVKVYMNGMRKFVATANGGGLTPTGAQAYVDRLTELGFSPSTVSTRAHAIMRYFRWMGENVRLDCPAITFGDPEYLTMEQFDKYVDACRTQLERALSIVLFDTAVRISELLALEVDDIDWANKLIKVTRKGGRVEEVNISDKALSELKKWLDSRASNQKSVFMGLTYFDAWSLIRKVGKRAGIEVHPHIFRHTRAIQMLMNGDDVHVVQQHLGHRSITTTMNIYGRFMAVHLRSKIAKW